MPKIQVKWSTRFCLRCSRRKRNKNVTADSQRCNTASYSKATWAVWVFDYEGLGWACKCDRQIIVTRWGPLSPSPSLLSNPLRHPLWVVNSWEDKEAQTNNWIRSRIVCLQIGQVLSAALHSMQEACPHWKTSLMWLSMQMGQVIRSSICR